MASISWAVRKQLTYVAFILIAILLVAGFLFYRYTRPTCFDGKLNQEEKGIDCGGPCAKECLGEVKNMVIYWSKVLNVSEGKYDAVALAENVNLFLAAKSVNYQFKLYDENNVLVALRQGKTYVNPGEKFVVFEPTLDTGSRIPKTAFLEFSPDIQWEKIQKEKDSLVVTKKEFTNSSTTPQFAVVMVNRSFLPVKNVFVAALLYDEEKNVIGASVSAVDTVKGEETREVDFTWPKPFSKSPDSEDVFVRSGGF